jgi:hypothetical protein
MRANFIIIGFVEILISIRHVRSISRTGGVLTPPCPAPVQEGLHAGLIGIYHNFSKIGGPDPVTLWGRTHTEGLSAPVVSR